MSGYGGQGRIGPPSTDWVGGLLMLAAFGLAVYMIGALILAAFGVIPW